MKKSILYAGLVSFVFALNVGPACLPATAADPVPPAYEAFWIKPPTNDGYTVFLWQFDKPAALPEAELGTQISELISPTTPEGESITAGTALDERKDVGFVLKGDAALDDKGRFGLGLRLGGRGWVESEHVNVQKAMATLGACTLDFWVYPEADAPDALLFGVPPVKNYTTLALSRQRDGHITLKGASGVLIDHPLPVPAGQWTHIALVLSSQIPSQLRVNGIPAYLPKEINPGMIAQIISFSGATLFLGGGPWQADGFKGRLDVVRFSSVERLFYQRLETTLCDAAGVRPVESGLPWFARTKAPNVYCSFDSTAKPDVFSGFRAEGVSAPSVLAEGVRGKAFNLGVPAATNFALTGQSVLPLERGTLEFWFKPQNWDNFYVGNKFGSNVKWLTLLRFAPRGSPAEKRLRSLSFAQGRSSASVGSPWVEFQPGKWTHVVCSWDGKSSTVYLDGKPQSIDQANWNGPLTQQDQKDYEAWLKASGGKDDGTYQLTFLPSETLVDELRVYPWAFTPEEANNAHVRYYPDGKSKLMEVPRLVASTSYDFYQKGFKFFVSCQPVNDIEPVAVTARLVQRGVAKPLVDVAKLTLDASLKAGWGAPVPLDYQPYELQISSLSADGKVLQTLNYDLNRKPPEWWQNDLGKDAIVPKPWTPIVVDGSTVKVWGREFGLGGGGLVTGVVSAAAQLLAAPPRLSGRVNGSAVQMEGGASTMVSQSPELAEWKGELRGGSLRAEVKASLEYDGLLYYTVTLKPAEGASVDVESLTLDFPLKRETATQFIVNGGGHKFRNSWVARFIPEGSNTVWHSGQAPWHKGVAYGNFCPMVWIGDDKRGLSFFGENDKGWTPGGSLPAQEIIRNGQDVIYRMNIISKPVKVTEGRTFTFVLHPTPTKALPSDWRTLGARGTGGTRTGRDTVDAFLGYTLTAPSSMYNAGITFQMEPVSWEDARINAANLKKVGGGSSPVMFYIDCAWPQMGPSMAEFKSTLWWTGRMTWTREVEDYFVWIINEYLKRGIIDGIYIDDVSFSSTRDLGTAAYMTDDGNVQPGFSSMGFRRFLKRLWVVFEKSGKRPIILPHMTYCFEMPALSFAECTVNGEDRDIAPFAGYTYPQIWSKEEVRVMGSSEKWGFVTFWKPGVRADFDYRKDSAARLWIYTQSRAMHALMMQHDYWYLWMWPTANGIRPVLAKFGIDDPTVRFVPYWNQEGKAEVSDKNMLLSLWTKEKSALVMVSNLSGNEQEVTLTVDPRKIFGPDAPARVIWTDVDTGLNPPSTLAASQNDIKQAEDKMRALDVSDLNTPQDNAVDVLMQNLETGGKPVDKLLLRPVGNQARVVVRKFDYRLMVVRPE